jgi:drug/metabolite transporter (DMT)-like permease
MTQSAATTHESQGARVPTQVWLVLLAGIAAVSFASIFIRFAMLEGVPSLVIAAGRLLVASLVLLPIVLMRHRADIAQIAGRDWLLIGVSGFFLAIHFATWVTSLAYTAVLISVVLVTTGPIWVALLEAIFLKARVGRWVVIGIVIAILGGIVIGIPLGSGAVESSAAVDSGALIGGGLALIGAITVSVYVVIGRELRPRVSVIPYIWLVYSTAALLLLAVVVITGTPITGYSAQGYLWILIMGLVPQLIGHSAFNYALGYLPATVVSIATQIEPIGSAVAAFVLFSEVPTWAQLLGSLILVIGVAIAIWGQGRAAKAT